ncbi:ashwin [Dunckerocampus dactyliophorus]|uniref:ashwin n=1 Tax=Dunckerocampus dactyliophorus TaxID=161453 RepID=UPI002405712F|nr:ashwin [Dunckerocampus dactyliophorus]
MAASSELAKKTTSASEVDVLLHPELLSHDFLQLILSEKRVSTRDCGGRDQLVDLYIRHVIPRPQRTLPNNRWGKRMAKARGKLTPPNARAERDHLNSSGLLQPKKAETATVSSGVTDRLKPPPAVNLSNPIRRLPGSSSSSSSSSTTSSASSSSLISSRSTDTTSLKREANSSGVLKSPDVKKKIQHVTWP